MKARSAPLPDWEAVTPNTETKLRHAIHAWIREDVPLAGKMNLYPSHVDALMRRLSAALALLEADRESA